MQCKISINLHAKRWKLEMSTTGLINRIHNLFKKIKIEHKFISLRHQRQDIFNFKHRNTENLSVIYT